MNQNFLTHYQTPLKSINKTGKSKSTEKFNVFTKDKFKKKHDGFTLKDIPRIEDNYNLSDPKFLNFSSTNFHCKKMINSLKLGSKMKIEGEINKPKRTDLKKINKIKDPKEYVDTLCELQNQKFGNIFNLQKDTKVLEEKRLPKIKNEVKKIELSKNFYNNGNSKFMGGTYNPYNYELFSSKNRTKRNVFGTLFSN